MTTIHTTHTPAYKLFHYKFDYRLPAMHFYTPEYQRTHGIFSSGDKAIDRTLLERPVQTRGTIIDMARHAHNDVPLELVQLTDAVTIYEIVAAHLAQWREAVRAEYNLPEVPLEELEMLDNFAVPIYQIARRYKPEIVESRFQRQMRQNGGFNRRSNRPAEPAKVSSGPAIKEHNPVFMDIEDYLARRGGLR